eukprot:scaffold2261_cov124-Cylindrotheca_fusiformis.AAC.2
MDQISSQPIDSVSEHSASGKFSSKKIRSKDKEKEKLKKSKKGSKKKEKKSKPTFSEDSRSSSLSVSLKSDEGFELSSNDECSPMTPGELERKQQRARQGKKTNTQPRFKSSSLGALDKKKQGRYLRKQSIFPVVSPQPVDDDDSSVEISDWSSEDEAKKPSRPPRKRPTGRQVRIKSRSAGPLEKQAQAAVLKILSDNSSGSEQGSRPARPVRVKRTAAQPRVKSSSAGALDKKIQEQFLKPRKLSSGALQAKAHVERSVQESSLHVAQPDIRLAIPRVRSAGALNARRPSQSPGRINRKEAGPTRKWKDTLLDRVPSPKATSSSPPQRKWQSERKFAPANNESPGLEEFSGPVLPLPRNMKSRRSWGESKQADQIPSMDKALSARLLALSDADDDGDDDETWLETLRDEDDQDKARRRDREEPQRNERQKPKKMSSLPQVALPLAEFTPSGQKDSKMMSQNLKALLAPGAIQDQKEKRRRRRKKSEQNQEEKDN